MCFADDIALFSNDEGALQHEIEELNQPSLKVGFRINMQKTKVMLKSLARKQKFVIGSQPLESGKSTFI